MALQWVSEVHGKDKF